MPPFLSRVTSAVTVLVLATSCGSSQQAPQAEPCVTPIEVEAPGLPKAIPLEEWGTIVRYEQRAGFVGAEAISEELIVELYPEIVRTLTEAGYSLLGGDNEGFEAEISFLDPKERYINIILTGGRCSDQVRMRILIEKRIRS